MASRATLAPTTSTLTVNIYDGTRQPFQAPVDVLYQITDGHSNKLVDKELRAASIKLTDLPFYNDNWGDNYTVLVWAKGYQQAGFTPVKLSPSQPAVLDLMLIPTDPGLNFADASWDAIKAELPFLANGVSDAAGKERYENLMEDKPKSLAALLNITTAMRQISLHDGTPLDYLKQIIWNDTLAQDRFFAYCDAKLIDEVRLAAAQGEFAPEFAPWLLHPGATLSWKQIQFGEANVQLTFHGQDTPVIDGIACVRIEPDIDYFKDPGAHAVLEVLPNLITHGLTNPEVVYVLRWIAGRHAGVPDFSPPYSIVA
jgi:hypothetical protein